MCHELLGRVYAAMREDNTALRHFQIGLETFTQVGNQMEAARVLSWIGQTYQRQGENRQAQEYYQTALESFRSRADQINQTTTLYALVFSQL
jgi:tetratricopeptide (TPR) repeat protein